MLQEGFHCGPMSSTQLNDSRHEEQKSFFFQNPSELFLAEIGLHLLEDLSHQTPFLGSSNEEYSQVLEHTIRLLCMSCWEYSV
jgi:hypothetical protein